MFLTPRYELVSFLIKFNHQFCYFLEATLKKPLLYSITRYRSKGDLTVINKKKCVNVSEFIIYQFQYCHYSSKFRFNVHSIQFKNSVVANFISYKQIQFCCKAALQKSLFRKVQFSKSVDVILVSLSSLIHFKI